MAKHKTNEWEFQGQIVSWLNSEIGRRAGLGLDKATQEPSKLSPKRNDLVIWWNRNSESAFLTIELKTPETRITDPKFFTDANEKACRWEAPFFALWNMQSAELYSNPKAPEKATPKDLIKIWEPDSTIFSVDDWLNQKSADSLRKRAVEILDTAWQANLETNTHKITIDASLFVARLANRVSALHAEILPELKKKSKSDRNIRRKIRGISAAQGFIGIIDDLESAIAGQYSYRLIGQVLFYFALRRKQPRLRPLEFSVSDILPDAFRPYWDDVRHYDYEALFEHSELDSIVPLPKLAQRVIKTLVDELSEYDWNSLRDDVLGSVFENLIPKDQQLQYGQFYTPQKVADVLISFTVDSPSQILDPGCGSGTFLMRAYEFLRWKGGLSHEDLLSNIWGVDISPFAAELAAINLFRQDLSSFENFPRIIRDNFFELKAGKEIMFPPVRIGVQEKIPVPIPIFDVIIGNPPYLRSQNQDDLDPKYKARLFEAARDIGIKAPSKTDLFAFFIYKSLSFMKTGSRIGFVTSGSWLTANFGLSIQRLLFEKLKLVALISSSVESFFSQVEVNTVLLIAEKRAKHGIDTGEGLRFVTLKKPLSNLVSDKHNWSELNEFVDLVESSAESSETEDYRINIIDAKKERDLLESKLSKETLNWSLYLRAPISYFKLFCDDNDDDWCELRELSQVGLGYKSLQNQFFYLSKDSIDSYKIEEEFLESIFMMKDISLKNFLHDVKSSSTVFHCRSKKEDLRGTGALRYIQSMAKRPATMKKQSGSVKTIEAVLALQGSGDWYAPKAQLHKAHIWLRKAYSDNYAPFIFQKPVVFDQRCNYITPRKNIDWELLAALFSSSVFALSIESHGSASMGAGALEMATRTLPQVRVVDVRKFGEDDREEIKNIARKVWKNEKTVNWTKVDEPGLHMQHLDQFLLKKLQTDVDLTQLYKDLVETCASRFRIAKDKSRTKKKNALRDIEAIADIIVASVRPNLESKRFPEDFFSENDKITFISLPLKGSLTIIFHPFLTEASLSIKDTVSGRLLLHNDYPTQVADIIVRSIMIGRREFKIPLDCKTASDVLDEFMNWFPKILELINIGCMNSSVGTQYEEAVLKTVMEKLSFHPAIKCTAVYGEHTID